MRIGVICSGGGSAFFDAFSIFRKYVDCSVHLITDRECGARGRAAEAGCTSEIITEPTNENFSLSARNSFEQIGGVDVVLLFYNRLVDETLFETIPTINIHPSLLPAFRGLGAIEQTRSSGVRFVGVTAHIVDETVDGGPIVSQSACPLHREYQKPDHVIRQLEKILYLQKVYITLQLLSYLSEDCLSFRKSEKGFMHEYGNTRISCYASPCILDDRLLTEFRELEAREHIIFSRWHEQGDCH